MPYLVLALVSRSGRTATVNLRSGRTNQGEITTINYMYLPLLGYFCAPDRAPEDYNTGAVLVQSPVLPLQHLLLRRSTFEMTQLTFALIVLVVAFALDAVRSPLETAVPF